VISFFVAALLGYLVGSVPVAYVLVKWKYGVDIRQAGSGNVGTLNSYVVTRSWLLGATVLLLDTLKGVSAALLGGRLDPGDPRCAMMAGVAAVIGHNFPVWLSFRGGRGLATASGVMLVVAWPVVGTWLVLWGISFLFTRQVNPANAIASALMVIGAMVVPDEAIGSIELRLLVISIMTVILIKHIEPLRLFFQELWARRCSGTPRPKEGSSQ
jgi:glycerol-3-phosphate acyltransferase PlsY